jgi:hypothetical protein
MAVEKPKPRMLSLPVDLDEKAVMVRAREMANVSKGRNDKAIELDAYTKASKAAKDTLTGELAALDAHLSLLGTVVRTAQEYRDVEVLDEIDAKKGVMNTIRLDTNTLVGTRGLTEVERQRSLFTEQGKAAASGEPKTGEGKKA